MRRDGLELCLRNVGMRYGTAARPVPVLQDVNLQVPAGDYLVIIGRSGSGKSTLLNLLGCLDRPTAGEVMLDGRSLAAMGERELAAIRRRRIGFVFQTCNLIPTLTVLENLLVPLQLVRTERREALKRVAELVVDAGLAGCERRFPEELSGGEQQRVAIIRAIAHRPSVVIADEPTGNLDLQTAGRTLELLESVGTANGRSLIMATHSPEVMGRASRILEIRDARLHPAALPERPG